MNMSIEACFFRFFRNKGVDGDVSLAASGLGPWGAGVQALPRVPTAGEERVLQVQEQEALWAGAPSKALAKRGAQEREGTKCVDAMSVALMQAIEDGQKKSWFVSTKQLQLASLELCTTCRSIPALNVKIAHGTPRSMWVRRANHSWLYTTSTSSQDGGTSRVPFVRALTLTWNISTKALFHLAARELWEKAETLRLAATSTRLALESSTMWPRGVRRLVLDALEVPVGAVVWPAAVEEISFGDGPGRGGFDQPITGVVWPSTLRKLHLGYCFNQAITDVAWPSSLDHLSLGHSFNQPIARAVWPTSLKTLSFGEHFNQSIVGVAWPPCLQQLLFDRRFNQPIARAVLPPSLKALSFGAHFNQSIAGVVWPASLRSLLFGYFFNQPIATVAWPPGLEHLMLEARFFNQPIEGVAWPATLETLHLGNGFNQPITGVAWPASLKILRFGQTFNQSIAGVVWPSCLVVLGFGRSFKQPTAGAAWPDSLKERPPW